MIEAVIKRILEEHQTLFGIDTRPILIERIVTHRPYSIIARLTFAINNDKRTVFIKIPYKNDSAVEKEFKILKYYHNKFAGHPAHGVIKPIAYLSDPPVLVVEEGYGKAFDAVIKREAKLFPSNKTMQSLFLLCRNCGEWLRDFQSFTPYGENNSYNLEDTIAVIHEKLIRSSEEHLLEQGLISKIKSYIDFKDSYIADTDIRITGMHSDFVLSNILVAEDKVNVLDFSGFKQGPMLRDICTFLYSLEGVLINPLFRPETIDSLKREFLLGYGWDNKYEDLKIYKMLQLSEILGGILQLSKRSQNRRLRSWIFKKMQQRSNKLMLSIVT